MLKRFRRAASKRIAGRLWLAVASLMLTSLSSAFADTTIVIRYPKANSAALTCAQALRDSVARIRRGASVVLTTDKDIAAKSAFLEIVLRERPGNALASAQIVNAPFAFRDPAHFQAFVKSDIYSELRRIDGASATGDPWVTVAYGGFYHLFSVQQAMIEPKHFFKRFVGGADHDLLYNAFDAIGEPFGDPEADIRTMRDNPNMMSAVEVPLIEANTYSLGSVAKFLNLSFTAAYPVFFELVNGSQLLPVLRLRATAWAEAAAATCSSANFAAEQNVLEGLKTQGVTVVPVNRRVFASAGYIYEFKQPNIGWTVNDYDRLVHLGDEGSSVLPSAVLAKLPGNARAKIEKDNAALVAARKKSSAQLSTQFAVQASWLAGLAEIAGSVRALDPPTAAYASGSRGTTTVMPFYQAKTVLEDYDAVPKNSDCMAPPCPGRICIQAAKTLTANGNIDGARRLLAALNRYELCRQDRPTTTNTFESALELLGAQVALRDPAADDALNAMVRHFPIPGAKPQSPAAREYQKGTVHLHAGIAVLYGKVGNAARMNALLLETADAAAGVDGLQIADLAEAWQLGGDHDGALEALAQAVEAIGSPSQLVTLFAINEPLRQFAPVAARLVEKISELERPLGLADDSQLTFSAAPRDWVFDIARAAELWAFTGAAVDEAKRLRAVAAAAEPATSKSDAYKKVYSAIDRIAAGQRWPTQAPSHFNLN